MSNFEQYLQESLNKHDPKEIEELILDNLWEKKENFTEEEKSVLEKYTSLIHLSLNGLSLKSLENFPYIKNLHALSLNDNDLNGDDFDLIKNLYPYLHKLKITGNKIEKIDNLAKLKTHNNLKKIEVKENPFSVGNNKYKEKLFDMLPYVQAIDKQTRQGEEIESTDYYNEEAEDDDDEDYNEKSEKSFKNLEKSKNKKSIDEEEEEENEEESWEKDEDNEEDED